MFGYINVEFTDEGMLASVGMNVPALVLFGLSREQRKQSEV